VNNDRSNRVAAGDDSRDPRLVDERLEDVGPLSGGWTQLTTDAAEILAAGTTAVEVVSHLDCGRYAGQDPYPE